MDESTVACMDCQKRFQFEESLVVHHSVCLKHQETKSRRPFTCEQCGKSFKSMTSLRNHARTHTSYFDVTKEMFDHTLMSTLGPDSTFNVLESTRTSEADVSGVMNRSLDISAVLCSDSDLDTAKAGNAHSTFTCNNATNVNADADGANGTCSSHTTQTENRFTVDTDDNDTTHTDSKTSTDSPNTTYTANRFTVDTDDKDRTYTADITITKTPTKKSTTFSLETPSDKTYVFNSVGEDRDTDEAESTVIALDKTYVWDGGRRLSPDITYLVIQGPQPDDGKDKRPEAGDSSRDKIDAVVAGRTSTNTRRRSAIPVPIINQKSDNGKQSQLVTDSPMTGSGPSTRISVKSIRTLRDHRSRSRTPVKSGKSGNLTGRKTRSNSRSCTPHRASSVIRSATPNRGLSSKYAVRLAGIDYMRAESPFTLTPLSPRVTPLGKGWRNAPDVAPIKCKKCGKVFNDKDQYEIHYVIHVRDTPSKCGIPSNSYKKNSRKLQFSTPDMPAARTPNSHQCPHCQRCYQSEKYLQSHMKIHYIHVPHACSHCDKRFKYVQSLRAHAISHIGEEINKTKFNYQKGDKVTESNERSSSCYRIIEKVKDSEALLESSETDKIHKILEQHYACNTCPYKTSQPLELLKHMKTHSRARPYKCTECDKSYKTRSNLELHGKVHMIGKIKTLLSNRRNSLLQQTGTL